MTPQAEKAETAIESARQYLEYLPGRLDERMLAILVLALGALSVKKLDEEEVLRLLATALYPRQRKRGGDKFANATRNIYIAGAVFHISHHFGLTPTRNRTKRNSGGGDSACSIVAAALGRLGVNKVNLSEDAVEKIWIEGRELYDRGGKGAAAMSRLLANCKPVRN